MRIEDVSRGWLMTFDRLDRKKKLQARSNAVWPPSFTAAFFILASILAGLLTARPSEAGLIAFYPFEGNANDVSGNGLHGTIFGDVQLTASGFQGSAYEFGATSGGTLNDYIGLPFGINPATYPDLTMGAWVNTDINVVAKSSKVLGHDDGSFDRTLGMDPRSGTALLGSNSWAAFAGPSKGVFRSGVPVSTGQWVFLAVVYNQSAATVRLHVNDQNFVLTGATLGSSALNVTIGKSAGFGSNEAWDGRIDNVFFFDEALSVAQVEEIRTNPSSIPEPSTFTLAALGLLLGAGYWSRYRTRRPRA